MGTTNKAARTTAVLFTCGLLAVGVSRTAAQIPDEFTNLRILPKDITKADLVGVMRGYASALGVRCNHCHVGENAATLEGFDFAADDKETKKVARAMAEMTREINGELLPRTGRESLVEVGCVTCHHGLTQPRSLSDVVLAKVGEEGVEAAVSHYRQLREEHHGDGAYDFSPGTLNSVAETLGRAKRDGALAMIRLNIEFHPESSYSHFIEGQLLMSQGDMAAGIKSMERALEIDPENSWYKQRIERARQRVSGN